MRGRCLDVRLLRPTKAIANEDIHGARKESAVVHLISVDPARTARFTLGTDGQRVTGQRDRPAEATPFLGVPRFAIHHFCTIPGSEIDDAARASLKNRVTIPRCPVNFGCSSLIAAKTTAPDPKTTTPAAKPTASDPGTTAFRSRKSSAPASVVSQPKPLRQAARKPPDVSQLAHKVPSTTDNPPTGSPAREDARPPAPLIFDKDGIPTSR